MSRKRGMFHRTATHPQILQTRRDLYVAEEGFGALVADVAKWDGSKWSNVGFGMNGTISALVAARGEIYTGGRFAGIDGITANHISKWGGQAWLALGAGVDGEVSALMAGDRNPYVGGHFRHAGGKARVGLGARRFAAPHRH